MAHKVNRTVPLSPPVTALDEDMERSVAQTSQAFATPSRVRILVRLWQSPATVTVLATDTGLEQSSVSHQLRILRDLRLVHARREGRNVIYSLHDDHVAIMLNEAIYHVEHLRIEGPRGGRSTKPQVAKISERAAGEAAARR